MDPAIQSEVLERVGGGVDRLLELAAQLSERARADEEAAAPPRVTLHLTSGQAIRGLLAGWVEDGADPALVIRAEADGSVSPDLTWVRIRSVDAVTLHDAELLLAELDDGPTASREELEQRAAELGEELSEALGSRVAIVLEEMQAGAMRLQLRALERLLEELGTVLIDLCGEPLGREALRQIHRIELGTSTALDIQLRGETLRATFPRSALHWPERQEVRGRMEAVL